MLAAKSLFHPYVLDCFLRRLAQLQILKTLRETHRPVGQGKWELDLSLTLLLGLFCFLFLVFCFVVFLRQGFSVNSTGNPGTHRNPPASASRVLGLKVCTTTARLLGLFLGKNLYCVASVLCSALSPFHLPCVSSLSQIHRY